jgi:hypothetical protein
MKIALTLVGLLFMANAYSQKAVYSDKILSYKDHHFAVGDTVNVAYGSGTDGKFVFVSIGSGLGGVSPLESDYSKTQVVIDKIYKSGGRYLIRGKAEGVALNKFFIEPEGAIDKKEIE